MKDKQLPTIKDKEINPEWLAEWLHNTYEDVAIRVGWKTQKKCRVAYRELPVSNKRVMLQVATLLVDNLKERSDKLLLAHEAHAKEMLEFEEGFDDNSEQSYWRGRRDAIQALKGEVKK
jgi:uncharacterized protein YaeQ